MNGNSNTKPSLIQVLAVAGAILIALVLAFAIMWCAIWKIYIEASMQMLMGTILGGISGALTTILVGRNISQLNQPDEPIQTQINQPPNKPVPVAVEPKQGE